MTNKAITIYGIKSCDTMSRAFKWLNENGVEFNFHDYKKSGIDAARVKTWLKTVAPEDLINRRGTTWRKLSDEAKENLDSQTAVALILENQSLVKRPLLDINGKIYLGFKPEHYSELFKTS